MEIKSRCIALKTIKFKDNKTIVTCLVRELGRVAFIVNDGASREARRKRALMIPGSEFECVIDYRENRSLQTLHDLASVRGMLVDNPVKQAVILFICDFLNALLADAPADRNLYDYVDTFIRHLLQTHRSAANASVCFLAGMLPIVGIEPDLSTYRPGSCFDMTNGIFRIAPTTAGTCLDPEETAVIPTILRINPRNMHLYRFSRTQRSRQLEVILSYYDTHFGRMQNLHSLEILHSLFD